MVNASDPVEAGLVAILARPGGNVTGLSQQLTREIRAKQLQLLINSGGVARERQGPTLRRLNRTAILRPGGEVLSRSGLREAS